MAYGTPTDPVGGTVITVAWAQANVMIPIRWLRLMTGNADPPGSSYVVVSDSTTGTTWRKIPTDAIADLSITTAKYADLSITNGKIANVTISGDAKLVPSSITGNSGASAIGSGVIHANRMVAGSFDATQVAAAFAPGAIPATMLAAGAAVANIGYTPVNEGGDTIGGDLIVYRPGAPTTGFIGLGGPSLTKYIGNDGSNEVTSTGKIWTEGNDGPASGLAAQTAATATNAGNVTTSIGGVALASYNAPSATTSTTATTATTANSVAAGSVSDVGIGAANKDGVAGTPCMRTLGAGATQAAAGNHTHTAATITTNGSYVGDGTNNRNVALGASGAKLAVIGMSGASYGTQGVVTPGGTMATNINGGTTSAVSDTTDTISGSNMIVSATSNLNNSGYTYYWVAYF